MVTTKVNIKFFQHLLCVKHCLTTLCIIHYSFIPHKETRRYWYSCSHCIDDVTEAQMQGELAQVCALKCIVKLGSEP